MATKQSDDRKKRVKAVSPKGAAGYAWLNKPDTKFNEAGTYKVSLTMSEKLGTPLVDQMQDIFLEEFDKKAMPRANFPFKVDEESGDITFTFKSSKQPKIFDAKGNPILKKLNIGNGSILKAAISMGAYKTGMVTGVSAYLDAVQVIELVEFKSKSMFESEDGFTVSEDDMEDFDDETPDAEDEGDGNF